MNSLEIRKQLKMTYLELIEYLLIKYGPSQYSYFYTIEMRSVDKRVSRSDEGLFCHHIDEDKAIMLSSIKYAKKNPIEYQMANRLVYCNFIEHLILHIKISLEPKHPQANENEVQGFGGIKLITTHLNDYFDGYEVKRDYLRNALKLIGENYEDYIYILDYFIKELLLLNEDKNKEKKLKDIFIKYVSSGFHISHFRVYKDLINKQLK